MNWRDELRSCCASSDLAGAQKAAAALLEEEPGTAATVFAARQTALLAERLEMPEHRVAILSSFTADLLEPALAVSEFLAGRRLAFQSISYGQWYVALAEEGPLDEFRPDAIILLLHLEDVAPLLAHRHLSAGAELAGESDRLINALGDALGKFRERTATPIFLSTFIAAARGIERHFDRRTKPSRQGAIDSLNARIGELSAGNPGVYVFDYAGCVTDAGRSQWFDPVKAHHVGMAVAAPMLPRLAHEVSEALTALREPRRKLVAVDLDNTLWQGIVGEDGPEGIAVGGDYPGNAFSDFQAFLANLRASGVALVVVSKNNLADAEEAFQQLPNMPLKWQDFTAHRVNWLDKSLNLRDIADTLSLGTGSFVFADDSPLECDLVRSCLPEVTVIHLDGAPSLFAQKMLAVGGLHAVALTEEDRGRVESYAADRVRTELAGSSTPEEFLGSLDLTLTVRPPRDGEIERIAQLFGKTNQFNLTTKRYDVATIENLRSDPTARLLIARLRDRYGDYGLIGAAVTIGRDALTREIDSLIFSCRALGRRAEDALLGEVEKDTRAEGVRLLIGRYLPTKKNTQVAEFYPDHGYLANRCKGDGVFEKDLDNAPPLSTCGHITILRDSDSS